MDIFHSGLGSLPCYFQENWIDNYNFIPNLEESMSKDKNSVLDFIAWLSDLEERVELLEATTSFSIETGKVLIKNEQKLMEKAGERSISREVQFKTTFKSPPTIHLALTDIASDNNHDPSIKFEATKITNNGFTLIATTWQASNMHYLGVSWIAIEEKHILTPNDDA